MAREFAMVAIEKLSLSPSHPRAPSQAREPSACLNVAMVSTIKRSSIEFLLPEKNGLSRNMSSAELDQLSQLPSELIEVLHRWPELEPLQQAHLRGHRAAQELLAKTHR